MRDPAAGSRPDPAPPPRIWLVDGFNVLHAAVLRGKNRREWWKPPARDRLLNALDPFPDPDAELWVVFDGSRPPLAQPGGTRLRVVFAHSADDWLVARVKASPDPSQVAVVTADRQLAARVRRRGGRVVGPRVFLAACGPPVGPGA